MLQYILYDLTYDFLYILESMYYVVVLIALAPSEYC
jgi:hypothetical protein